MQWSAIDMSISWESQDSFHLGPGLSLLGQLRPLVACAGQLSVDCVSVPCPEGMEKAPMFGHGQSQAASLLWQDPGGAMDRGLFGCLPP